MKKKIPAILAAMLLTFGISVVSAAPSFASTTQVRCAYVKNLVIPGGYGTVNVPARLTNGQKFADCILYKNQTIPANIATTTLQQGLITCAQLGSVVGPADGVYGPNTESAVYLLQRQTGRIADGVYGNDTKEIAPMVGNPSSVCYALPADTY